MDLNELYQAYDALIISACVGSVIVTILILTILSFMYYGRRRSKKE